MAVVIRSTLLFFALFEPSCMRVVTQVSTGNEADVQRVCSPSPLRVQEICYFGAKCTLLLVKIYVTFEVNMFLGGNIFILFGHTCTECSGLETAEPPSAVVRCTYVGVT